jgi:hypothetical protein
VAVTFLPMTRVKPVNREIQQSDFEHCAESGLTYYIQAKKSDDAIISAVQRAKMLHMDFSEVIAHISENYAEDICNAAKVCDVELIIMGCKRSSFHGTVSQLIQNKFVVMI